MSNDLKKNTKGKTYALILLDKSGSMEKTREQAVEGFNNHVDIFHEWAKDPEVDLRVSLVTFNSSVYEHLWNVPAADLQKCNYTSFVPNGGTALRDGLGYCIDKMVQSVEPGPDDAFLFIIISDGDENESRYITPEMLKAKIEELEITGRWTFTYMGYDPKILEKVQRETGIKANNMAIWNNANAQDAQRGMLQASSKLNRYMERRTNKNGGQYTNTNFHSDDDRPAEYTSDQGHGVDANFLYKSNLSTAGTVDPHLPSVTVNVNNNAFWANAVDAMPANKATEGVDIFGMGGKVNSMAEVSARYTSSKS